MGAEFAIQQSEKYESEDWWEWAVWLEGPDDDLDHVDFVEWTLHPTFPDPIRKVTDRASKFRLQTGGWGTFKVHAFVQMKDGERIKLHHQLRLHYPSGAETQA